VVDGYVWNGLNVQKLLSRCKDFGKALFADRAERLTKRDQALIAALRAAA
jgi:hypothetical protein